MKKKSLYSDLDLDSLNTNIESQSAMQKWTPIVESHLRHFIDINKCE